MAQHTPLTDNMFSLDREKLMATLARLEPRAPAHGDDLLALLRASTRIKVLGDALLVESLLLQSPVVFVRHLLGKAEPDHVLRYYVARNVRRHHRCARDGRTQLVFRQLSLALNRYLQQRSSKVQFDTTRLLWAKGPEERDGAGPASSDPAHTRRKTRAILRTILAEALSQTPWQEDAEKQIRLFVECCRFAGYVRPGRQSNIVRLDTGEVDAEFLITALFGIPTGVEGLDVLFGGNGIVLGESWPESTDPEAPTAAGKTTGRAILIKGRFGSGKSLLTSQLAMSVVAKGGLAWVMAMEQPADDYLYTLASFGLFPTDRESPIATTAPRAAALIEERATDEASELGALVILSSVRDSFEQFLAVFENNGLTPATHPLRVLCVDPVNSIYRSLGAPHASSTEAPDGGGGADWRELPSVMQRKRFLDAITLVKANGTNVILVAEENADPNQAWFEENIVDTVIHLTEVTLHGYLRRFLEISKSRFQREQRGAHPYSIRPTVGLQVFPSAAAVDTRTRTRRTLKPTRSTLFGHPDLDKMLGENALSCGDVVVLRGPSATYKTTLGEHFLAQSDNWGGTTADRSGAGPVALLVTPRNQGSSRQDDARVRLCTPPFGHVHPAVILQYIEAAFESAIREGRPVDRVLVDNIAHWELSCPAVRDDETFADTLVNLLQRRRVTSVIICGDVETREAGPVQRPILDRADCVVALRHFDFRGRRGVSLRVLKTRSMNHRTEAHQVRLVGGIKAGSAGRSHNLRLDPIGSMIRLGPDHEVRTIPVRLFLHAESEAQARYVAKVAATIQSVVSTETITEAQSRLSVSMAINLGHSSAVDELQLIQLDEYQLPDPRGDARHDAPFLSISKQSWERAFIARLAKAASASRDHFRAIPLYADIGFLAYRKASLPVDLAGRLTRRPLDAASWWRDLARCCLEWERRKGGKIVVGEGPEDDSELFFEFSHVTVENYNCLFFEVLSSFVAAPDLPPSGEGACCRLERWLRPDDDQVVNACRTYWSLCRRAHQLDLERRRRESSPSALRPIPIVGHGNEGTFDIERLRHQPEEHSGPWRVSAKAVIWRHWFSTLSQMLSGLTAEQRRDIEVTLLPGPSVGGDWFIAIPSYSAASDVGVDLLERLTTPQANVERLHLGIGLPTYDSFYDRPNSERLSPYFSVPLTEVRNAIENAFTRSTLGSYGEQSEILGHHLKRLLETQPYPETAIGDADIRRVLTDLGHELRFARTGRSCSLCKL
ncbi:MAG TPA: ATPase domain-containing protein [Polyangiaceae bacterium]|nr:ATPase domain-containing protein [Polyangiaceae bacterium]